MPCVHMKNTHEAEERAITTQGHWSSAKIEKYSSDGGPVQLLSHLGRSQDLKVAVRTEASKGKQEKILKGDKKISDSSGGFAPKERFLFFNFFVCFSIFVFNRVEATTCLYACK